MGKDKSRNNELSGVGQQAGAWYNNLQSSATPLEKEYTPQSQQMWNNYMGAVDQNKADYGNIMGGYQNFAKGLGGPTQFTNQTVEAKNPAEQQEAYGYLRETMPGYRDFAQTGGYSPTDIQELRARGVAPIRTAYGNTMMEMNRSRALAGSGGATNYIAAASKAQRELPGQMADATTTVNANLADAIRQGKIQGLAGMSGVGATMGGLASQDAGRMLQAGMANQNADLQRQQLTEQSLQSLRRNQLDALQGQSSLYGTTPGMSSMFGNQALQAYQNRIALETLRNQTGLGLLGKQIDAYGGQSEQDPWWKEALKAASSAIPYLGNKNQQQQAGPSGSTPMGNYSPNNMGGQSFQGYQAQMPSGTPGNYNPQTSSNWGLSPNDPNYSQYYGNPYDNPYSNPYDTQNDPNLDPGNWYGYGPATNGQQFSGWDPGYGNGANDYGPEFSGPGGYTSNNPWEGGNGYANPWDSNYNWQPGDLMYDW